MGSRLVPIFVAITLLVGAATARADGDAIAIVNGSPISKQRQELLIESHGLDLLQQLVLLEVAKLETRKRNIKVTLGDADREFADTLSNHLAAESGLHEPDADRRKQAQACKRCTKTTDLDRRSSASA